MRLNDHAHYTVGHSDYYFRISFGECLQSSVYLYIDRGIKAVWLITVPDFEPLTVNSFLNPGRVVSSMVGKKAVPLNKSGAICDVRIDEVQREVNL